MARYRGTQHAVFSFRLDSLPYTLPVSWRNCHIGIILDKAYRSKILFIFLQNFMFIFVRKINEEKTMKKKLLILASLLATTTSFASENSDPLEQIFKRYQQHVVAIYNDDMGVDALTGEESQSMGTGFVIDPALGLIATNYHVFSHTMIAAPHISMFDGTVYEPRDVSLVYSNPTGFQHDFAILKIKGFNYPLKPMDFEIDPQNIPSQAKIGIMGCNEGIPESLIVGYLADKYNVESSVFDLPYGTYPSYTLSASTEGGSSGSPAFTSGGKVIGIHAAGSSAHAYIVPIYYILDILKDLVLGKIRPSYSLGIDFEAKQLHDLKEYRKFKDAEVNFAVSKREEYRKRTLAISGINPLFAKENGVEIGDVLKKVNGVIIGPDYYKLHQIVHQAGVSEESVNLTIDRFGKEVVVTCKPALIEAARIKGTQFLDVWIFPATATHTYHYGVKSNTPIIVKHDDRHEEEGTNIFKVTQIFDTKVETFDDFIMAAYKTIYQDMQLKFPLYLSGFTHSSNKAMADINLSMHKGKPLYVIQYNDKTQDWDNVEYKKYLKLPKKKVKVVKTKSTKKSGSSIHEESK